MRKSTLCMCVFVAFVMLFSGCSKGSAPKKEDGAPSTEPEQQTSTVRNTDEKVQQRPSTTESATAYDPLLQDYHQFILNYDYNSENDNEEIDEGKEAIWELFMTEDREDILNSVGYSIEDYNYDGSPDLLIGTTDSRSETMETGFLYAMYTLKGDRPQLVFAGNPRDQFYYLGEGEFANQNATGGDYSLAILQFGSGKLILEPRDLFFTQDDVHYHNPDGVYDTEPSEKLSPELFQSEIQKLVKRVIGIPFTTFSEFEKGTTVDTTKNSETNPEEHPLYFTNENDLAEFLVGNWTAQHLPSSKDMAWLTIADDRSYRFRILNPKNDEEYTSEGHIEILNYTLDENEVPNTLSFITSKYNLPEGKKDMYFGDNFDGDYSLTYKTLGDGEIIIELFQISNGDTFLFQLFDTPVHVFRRNSEFQQRAPIRKSADFYAICSKRDHDGKLIWLDDVEYDPVKQKATFAHPMESGAYDFSQVADKVPGKGTEYLCQLVKVITDADGKVIDYKEIENDNDSFEDAEEE